MSRYGRMFERLNLDGEGAFGAFLMLGDPDPETSATLLDSLVEGGADMIEVGVPFSDPIADGPVIQAAAKRALEAGVRISDCFDLIAGFREKHPDMPVGMLTYANLVVAGAGFLRDAADAGVDSLLLADVPVLEAEPFARKMLQVGIEPVLIAAANTPPNALEKVGRLSQAYTYCVSRTGVTGAHAGGDFDRSLIRQLEAVGAPPPVFGFGISEPGHVRAALAAGAAGVISGSAIVGLTQSREPRQSVIGFVSAMKEATRTPAYP